MDSDAPPRLYLDHAATSPLHPAAEAELRAPWSPSRLDSRPARLRLARALGLPPERVVLTCGGSQANALALRTLVDAGGAARGRALASQATEHPSLLRALEALESAGVTLRWLPLDSAGRVDPACLEEGELLGLSVMVANHETGACQPSAALAARARELGVPLHSDAVQALRFCPPRELSADLASLAGHKLGGPRGVGALLLGARAGELGLAPPPCAQPPAPLVHALAAALEASPPGPAPGLAESRDALQAELEVALSGLRVHGGHERLPGHLSLSLAGLSGEALVLELDLAGISVSSGAACASGAAGPSPVLLALGCSQAEATGSLRLSLGAPLSPAERARVTEALCAAVKRLRALGG